MQMAQAAPQGMYNLREINRVMLDAAGIENPDQFLIPEQKAEPRDPISDINAAAQGMPIKAFPGQDHQAHITVKQAFIADPTLGQNPIMQALVPVLQANIREHMIMQYEEQMTGMLQQGVQQAGVGSPEAISKITQGAAQEILQNNQRMAEQGSVEDLERMTLELQRQQLELEREKVKIDAAQKAADIAIKEEKLDLEKDALEVNSAEKLAKIKGVERDREIVASTKEADRNDKFLIEVMKMLVKETGATVEKLKEEVVLSPERFNQGGFAEGDVVGNPLEGLMGMIGNLAQTAAMPITSVIEMIFGDTPDPVMDQADDELSPDEWLELHREEINKEPDEFSEVKEKEEFKYKAPVTHEVEQSLLPSVFTGTGPFNKGLDLDPTQTMENIPKAVKSMQDRLKTELPISHPLDPEAQATMAADIVSLEDYGDIEGDIPVRKNVMEDRIGYTKRMQDALKGKVEPTPLTETTGESDDMDEGVTLDTVINALSPVSEARAMSKRPTKLELSTPAPTQTYDIEEYSKLYVPTYGKRKKSSVDLGVYQINDRWLRDPDQFNSFTKQDKKGRYVDPGIRSINKELKKIGTSIEEFLNLPYPVRLHLLATDDIFNEAFARGIYNTPGHNGLERWASANAVRKDPRFKKLKRGKKGLTFDQIKLILADKESSGGKNRVNFN
jgi:hypothetical protein